MHTAVATLKILFMIIWGVKSILDVSNIIQRIIHFLLYSFKYDFTISDLK